MIIQPLCLHFFFFFFFFTVVSSSTPLLPTNNFTLFGTAIFNNTSITLTQPLHNCTSFPPDPHIGRAFYRYPIRFLDSSFNSTVSFSTRFSFTVVSPAPPCLSGEGLAFLIASESNSLPFSVGCMGLPKSLDPNSLDSTFLAVEFDTRFNQDLRDINDNHVAIDLDSIFSVASVDLTSNGVDLKSGKEITAWVEYRNPERMIRVWVGYTKIRPESPILMAPMDLSKRFHGFMYVGFSASNGRGSAVHSIHNFQFTTSESMPSNLEAETVGSRNCLICYPGKEEHKTGSSPDHHHHRYKGVLELALGLLGVTVILILLTVCFVVLYIFLTNKKTQELAKKRNKNNQMNTFQENKMPRRLKLSEIRSATKGFNQNQIIGQGVCATVYEATLPLCGTVAVKRFSHVDQAGSFGNQFITEFATMVGCLRHKNLVQLRGWCCERNELLLVYEHMPNGSLDKILHHPTTSANKSLTFEKRLNILLGVSSALVYLHEECEQQIIHRDVKTCNIMLDAELNAKLGDFGLAEVYEHSSRTRDATLPAGTMGYLAPEYVYSGVPTVKTDVYSFGVVVLEVASGRRPVDDDSGVVLADWVWGLWEKKRLIVAADCNLMGRFYRIDMEMMLMVGMICVHPNYEQRPTMKEAALMLRGGLVPDLPAVRPTVVIQSVMGERSPEMVARCAGEDSVTPWSTPSSHFSRVI